MGKIFSSLGDLTLIAFWVLIFTFVKFVASPKSRGWRKFLIDLIVSFPTGVLCGAVATENGFGEYTSIGVACVACLMAHHLVVAVTDKGEKVGEYADSFIKKIIDKWTK